MKTTSANRQPTFTKAVSILLAILMVWVIMYTITPRSANAALPAVPAGWTQIWSDDFTGGAGTGLNTANWIYDIGNSYPGGAANWGTGEIAAHTNSTANVYQDGGGNLAIKPIRAANGSWTSGRIETVRTDFQPPAGGVMRVESRLQLPNVTGAAAQGIWPAFWMLGAPFRGNYQNWPAVGEIDIMENVNGANQVWGTLHCGTSPGGICNETSGIGGNRVMGAPSLQSAFHTFAIEWDRSVTPNQMRWYVDGIQYHTVNQNQVDAATWNNATNHGYFIILNVAIGGGWPGGPTGSTASGVPMLVDYVTVYTRGGGTPPPPPPPPGGTRYNIPGQIQAENYVAMSGVQVEATTDAGGGSNVGYIETNDWMDYNVNVTTAGNYTVQYRVASTSATGSIQLRNGASVLATTAVPNTGGWQTWTTITSATVNLPAGQYTLRLHAAGGGFNINWLNFVSGGGTTPPPPPGGTTGSGPFEHADYTAGTTKPATTSARIYFTPKGYSSAYVDVHYLVNGGGQQNFRMTNVGGTWEKVVSSVSAATKIEYWFTYNKGTSQYDSVHYTHTQ
jgi:hypothetical protein